MLGIVIPAYNRRDCLREALNSLVAQTNKKFFVIVVDDHSPEPLEAVAKEFEDRLNIKYIYAEKNGGPGAARQIGLDICYRANFDYIMFLDSDDSLVPNTVQRLTYEISHGFYDIVSSAIWAEDKTGTGVVLPANNKTWLHGKIYRLKYLKDNNINFPDLRTNEDLAFNLMAIESTQNKAMINETLYIFRNEKNSITRSGDNTDRILSVDYISAIYCVVKYFGGDLSKSQEIIADIVGCFNHYQYGLCIFGKIEKDIHDKMSYLINLPEFQSLVNTPTEFRKYMHIPAQSFYNNKKIYYFQQTFSQWLGAF